MAVDVSELEFNRAFIRRVKELREGAGWTQAFMAELLGIPLERYKKYEQRSLLPHYLIDRFCKLTGCDIHYLLTERHPSSPLPFALPFDRRRR